MFTTLTADQLAALESRLAGGLSHGVGTRERACAVASLRLVLEPDAALSDELPCASPSLRRWVIAINDSAWSTDTARAAGMVPALRVLAGSAALSESDVLALLLRAAFAAADKAVRVDAPAVLRAAGRVAEAERMEALEPIVDRRTALAAAYAAYAAAYAYAYDAADAADAARAAYAAYAAAAADAANARDQVLADAVQAVAEGVAELLQAQR